MSNLNPPPDEGSFTDEEFQTTLHDLIHTARNDQFDVCGCWAIDGEDGPTDFQVEITRVRKDR